MGDLRYQRRWQLVILALHGYKPNSTVQLLSVRLCLCHHCQQTLLDCNGRITESTDISEQGHADKGLGGSKELMPAFWLGLTLSAVGLSGNFQRCCIDLCTYVPWIINTNFNSYEFLKCLLPFKLSFRLVCAFVKTEREMEIPLNLKTRALFPAAPDVHFSSDVQSSHLVY